MTTQSVAYGSPTTIACTTTSLATDSNFLAGRTSAAVNNSSDLAVDCIMGGTIATTGTPTANTGIEVWLYGSWDGGTLYSGAAGGTDANQTFVQASKQLMTLVAVIQQLDTTARTYTFGPISVAAAFGGTMPDHWGFFVVHNTGTNLGATAVKYTPVKYSNA